MTRVISCASYYGTGSSAITDYFSEYDNVFSLTNYEFRFLQDPDGISDLEFNLVENHNRHNSGHSIKRFKRLVDFNSGTCFNKRYESFFQNKYKALSYDYINKLTDFTFNGYWFYDFYDKGRIYYYLKILPGKLWKLLHPRNKESTGYNALPNEITYCSKPSYEKFLTCTKDYINELLNAANTTMQPYIMVDQMVPPSNVSRYTKYFFDIKVFVVDRDPRDVFILSKYIWKDRVVPTDTVEIFCKWFKYTRSHRKTEIYNTNTTMLIQFEDLIYKYAVTTKKMSEWVGLDFESNQNKKSLFDPSKSMLNTRLWVDKPEYADEIAYIEQNLKEYLYDYSSVGLG